MKIALRVDVDTYRGTRDGVPNLCRVLDKHGVRAAFFFSAGPDNMGRHIWRLLKPAFLWKMMRTRAASLYGMDILLMGTMWPGPKIGKNLASVIRACAEAGHEIGVHAWDHHGWQAHVDQMSPEAIYGHIRKAYDELERDGYIYTVAAKGCYVAEKNAELIREEHLRQLEAHLREAAGLAALCGITDGEILELYKTLKEE